MHATEQQHLGNDSIPAARAIQVPPKEDSLSPIPVAKRVFLGATGAAQSLTRPCDNASAFPTSTRSIAQVCEQPRASSTPTGHTECQGCQACADACGSPGRTCYAQQADLAHCSGKRSAHMDEGSHGSASAVHLAVQPATLASSLYPGVLQPPTPGGCGFSE